MVKKKKQQQSSMMWPTSHLAKPSDGVLHNSDFVREKKKNHKIHGIAIGEATNVLCRFPRFSSLSLLDHYP